MVKKRRAPLSTHSHAARPPSGGGPYSSSSLRVGMVASWRSGKGPGWVSVREMRVGEGEDGRGGGEVAEAERAEDREGEGESEREESFSEMGGASDRVGSFERGEVGDWTRVISESPRRRVAAARSRSASRSARWRSSSIRWAMCMAVGRR